MEFTNSFEVSLAPDQAWPWLMDIESIVPCMPGAELIEKRDDGSFKGKISVRLGPVGLVFVCDAKFTEVDNTRHKAQIAASGADAKGRGAANAGIGFALQPSARGSKVLIDTQLELSGAVAQYGRGVGLIQNVANQIVSQFAQNLEARIAQLKEYEAQTGRDAFASRDAGPASEAATAGEAAVEVRGHERVDTQVAVQLPAADTAQTYMEGFKAGFSAGHAAGYQAALQAYACGDSIPGRATRNGPPPFPAAKPISGFSLFFSSLGQTIAGWFSRRPQ